MLKSLPNTQSSCWHIVQWNLVVDYFNALVLISSANIVILHPAGNLKFRSDLTVWAASEEFLYQEDSLVLNYSCLTKSLISLWRHSAKKIETEHLDVKFDKYTIKCEIDLDTAYEFIAHEFLILSSHRIWNWKSVFLYLLILNRKVQQFFTDNALQVFLCGRSWADWSEIH